MLERSNGCELVLLNIKTLHPGWFAALSRKICFLPILLVPFPFSYCESECPQLRQCAATYEESSL